MGAANLATIPPQPSRPPRAPRGLGRSGISSGGRTRTDAPRIIITSPARVRAFREAKRRYAVTLVEHTGELVKHVKENRDAIAKVREQASHARWEASKWDRELFGEDKGDVNVNVLNIGALHVEALRHRIIEAPGPLVNQLGKGTVPLEIAPRETDPH